MDRLRPAATLVLCLVLVVTALVIWRVRSSRTASYPATVTVDATAKPYGNLGSRYAGLSVESSTLDSGKLTSRGDLAALLHNLGRSVLRLGGNSADTTFTGTSLSALQGLVALADASGWSVLYTEDLGHYDADQVAADADAVSAVLGDKLFAFACGNEPDAYPGNGLRPPTYSEGKYLGQAAACLATIQAAAPDTPLEGPDTAASRHWFSAYAEQEAYAVSWLGQHYYPMGCASPGESPATALTTLLSPALAATEAATLSRYAAVVHAVRLPLLITETNSACGGGIPGLSDSYASALWAIDYLLIGAEAGIAGMYFHTGSLSTSCAGYAVLCQTGTSSYSAQPIYYGLLFAHLLGTGRFLPVKTVVPAKSGGNVAAFALKTSDGGLRLMVENLSPERLNATIRGGKDAGSATVLNLTGPGPLATSGVEIQGASVGADGQFSPGAADTVRCSAKGCPVDIAPYSAALVTLG